MKNRRGFTVVELMAVIVLFVAAGLIFFSQKQSMEAENRDEERKTDINAMVYALEQVYHPAKDSYPNTIDEKSLAILDPELMTDPQGRMIGQADSDYRYEPTGCSQDRCSGFTLRALLEREADYVITSQP